MAVLIPTGTQASPADRRRRHVRQRRRPRRHRLQRRDRSRRRQRLRHRLRVLHDAGVATRHRHAGYWKNHPDAWPVDARITVGGVTYTKAQAIAWLGKVGKDKTTTMFSSLVPAMLNVLIGNDGSCVNSTIAAANAWMATYGPVGSNVAGVELRVVDRRTAAHQTWTPTTTACSALRIASRPASCPVACSRVTGHPSAASSIKDVVQAFRPFPAGSALLAGLRPALHSPEEPSYM